MSGGARQDWLAGPGAPLAGELSVPGDKSVSHRAVMLGALAEGETRVEGFLEGEDTRATSAVFARLGVRIEDEGAGRRRIQGVGLETIAAETIQRHEHAWPTTPVPALLDLDVGGQYQWRRKGEAHIMNPDVVARLQQAVRINSREEFKRYCLAIDEQQTRLLTLRGLLTFKPAASVPLEEVEPASEIVRRFSTGAMSYSPAV